MSNSIKREMIENFLYAEAKLLDTWKLTEWLALFTDDAGYYVPSTDLPHGADYEKNLFYVADDRARLNERIIRLMKKTAHAEYPRSRTRHMVNNVMFEVVDNNEIKVEAVFATYRIKNGNTDTYIGTSYYTLISKDNSFMIKEKICELALENLRPHGRVSIIL